MNTHARKRTARKTAARLKRKIRIRKRVFGTPDRPRLVVFKSTKHIYAQVVDDVRGVTLLSTSTVAPGVKEKITDEMRKLDQAKLVGEHVAELCSAKNIKTVSFDRNGFPYHGRIKALADAAREKQLSI